MAAVALAGLAGATGCGEDEDTSGTLRWVGKPRVFTPANLPNDRTLTGRVRNDTLKMVEVESAREAKLFARDGHVVPAAVIFNNVFLRTVYSPTRPAGKETKEEVDTRIGLRASLKPGKTAPLTVSWRTEADKPEPVRIEIAGSSLDIPAE